MVYYDTSNVGAGEFELTPVSGTGLSLEVIDNVIYIISHGGVDKITYDGGGAPQLTNVATTSNPVSFFWDSFYAGDNNGNLLKIAPDGSSESIPNVLSGSGYYCDPWDVKIYHADQNAIVYFCDDTNTATMGPAVYSFKQQRTYALTSYGVTFDQPGDRVYPVSFINDLFVVYTVEHRQFCPDGKTCPSPDPYEVEFDYGKLIEINDNTGIVNFAAVDSRPREISPIKNGMAFTCYDGEPTIFNYNINPADKFYMEDTFCFDDAGVNAIVDEDRKRAYVPLLRNMSHDDIGLELFQIRI